MAAKHSTLRLPTGEIVLFDSNDAELVSQHAWFNNGRGYACAKIRMPDGKRRTVGMHRLILGFPPGPIDHINREKLDNRRVNLRRCTPRENMLNQVFDWPKQPDRSSVYKGVSRRGDRWQVVVRQRGGKLLWLGTYGTEEEAAQVAKPYFLPYQA